MADRTLGVGVDIGTMNIVSARQEGGTIKTKQVRNAFLDLDVDVKKALKMGKVSFYEDASGQLIVLGDSALSLANLFKRETRRPLARGLIAAGELGSQNVLSQLIFSTLEEPFTEGEHCYYSVPAEPLDLPDQDIVYHTEVFRRIIEGYGYKAHPMNEAMAIIYSQCVDTNFSGLSVSFGSGMGNVALAYQTMMGLSFSLARGGDWIDIHAAKAVGSTASRMCSIKEKGGFNLASPPKENREAEAISLYIRALIRYCLDRISMQVRHERSGASLEDPIPFVVSGGTSLAEGFMTIFEEEFRSVQKRGFPVAISGIRQAKNPMTAVAEGLLVLAMQES